MRAVPILVALIIAVGGAAPAPAIPLAAAPERAASQLLSVKHHWHYRHWRYRYQGGSPYQRYYTPPAELQTTETPSTGYGYGSANPPATGYSYGSTTPPPLPTAPDAGTRQAPAEAPSSRPRIEWVNPDRTVR